MLYVCMHICTYVCTYIYIYEYINTDLYPGKSKTVPPPILSTNLVRSLIKISIVQTNIRETVRNGLHALSTYYIGVQEHF